MKKWIVGTAFFALVYISPVWAQGVHRVSASGEIPIDALSLKEDALVSAGESLLSAGNYASAEQDFRSAMTISKMEVPGFDPSAERGLAEALTAQGKTEEAFTLYKTLIYTYPRQFSSVAQETRTLMHYAILLSQTGQWAEAVSMYKKALLHPTNTDDSKLDMHFDPQVPMPQQLQSLAYVAVGLEYSGHGEILKAVKEYANGQALMPNSALTNYYYGQGWEQLDPADQAKFGTAEQAKAALQKAVKLGKGSVKQAAQSALQVAMKPK